MTGNAILSIRCDVARIRSRTQRTFRALGPVGSVVAGITAARAHRRVVHRVGGKARCRISVAIAALDAGDRDMRWCRIASRCRAVVTARAVGVARLVNENAAGPACVGGGRTGVTRQAILAVRCDVTCIRGTRLRSFSALVRI